MELIVVGSGTGVPSLKRGSPGYGVRAGGRLVFLDLGPGVLRAMLRFGLNFSEIDVLALTHLPPDPVGDLVPFSLPPVMPWDIRAQNPSTSWRPGGSASFMGICRKPSASGWSRPRG